MDTAKGNLTVFFDAPFWVGVFERTGGGNLSVCRVVFGAEPTDAQVWDLILRRYGGLTFSPAVAAEERQAADSPKRRQRSAQKLLRTPGIGTKSQQALRRQREEQKTERRRLGKEEKDAARRRQFEQKRQKRKAKHRGH